MKSAFVSLFASLLLVHTLPAQTDSVGLVWIEGGVFQNPKSAFHGQDVMLPGFYLGRTEVTQQEWREVMGTNPSEFKGDHRPVERVSWYDCIEYCNRRSEKEGLKPYYLIDRATKDPQNASEGDTQQWSVGINAGADGYRLPTEIEWEYAASGGARSRGFTYSGGNEIGLVAWFWQNSGEKPLTGLWAWGVLEQNKNSTKEVGTLAPNELGLFDLSGNVREWCWDWHVPHEPAEDAATPASGRYLARVWKGGGWMGGDFCCEPAFRAGFEPNGTGADQGFRVCRSK